MMLLFGTVPNREMPLTVGPVKQAGDYLIAEGRPFSRTQGTGAMISAALAVTTYLGRPPPQVLIAGDIGEGQGTRELGC